MRMYIYTGTPRSLTSLGDNRDCNFYSLVLQKHRCEIVTGNAISFAQFSRFPVEPELVVQITAAVFRFHRSPA